MVASKIAPPSYHRFFILIFSVTLVETSAKAEVARSCEGGLRTEFAEVLISPEQKYRSAE